jgi:hypothetical protein
VPGLRAVDAAKAVHQRGCRLQGFRLLPDRLAGQQVQVRQFVLVLGLHLLQQLPKQLLEQFLERLVVRLIPEFVVGRFLVGLLGVAQQLDVIDDLTCGRPFDRVPIGL